MNAKNSPVAHSNKKRQKKNRKGSVTSTVIGDTYSVKWIFYFWFHSEKQRYRVLLRDISFSRHCII